MPKYNIDINKVYDLPKDIKIIQFKDLYLVIAVNFANWIVLTSSSQVDVLEYFRKGHSIQDALNNPKLLSSDINYTVMQIEARKLQNKRVHSITRNKRSLHLYLTNKCNLACPHCYMFSGRPNDGELTTEEVRKLLYDYKLVAKGTRVTFSGGEPTSRIDFFQIILYAHELGLKVKVLTNGVLWSTDHIEEVCRFIDSVQVSIDGFSEESNAVIRGKNSFNKALSFVEKFVSHNIDTSVAITPPLSQLRNHVKDYANFAQYLASKYENCKFEVKFAEGLIHGRNINPSPLYNKEYHNLMSELQESLYGSEYEVESFAETFYDNVILDNCMFGVFAVASNGDVYFCPQIGDLSPIANIRTTSFAEICNESLIAEKATNISNLKPCNECELKYICGGGCRIKEFPMLTQRSTFVGFNPDDISPRQCSMNVKDKFYDMMIRSNRYLFKPID